MTRLYPWKFYFQFSFFVQKQPLHWVQTIKGSDQTVP